MEECKHRKPPACRADQRTALPNWTQPRLDCEPLARVQRRRLSDVRGYSGCGVSRFCMERNRRAKRSKRQAFDGRPEPTTISSTRSAGAQRGIRVRSNRCGKPHKLLDQTRLPDMVGHGQQLRPTCSPAPHDPTSCPASHARNCGHLRLHRQRNAGFRRISSGSESCNFG